MLKILSILVLFLSVFLSESPDRNITLSPLGSSLDGATSISIIPTGEIYITERNRHRFLVLNSAGFRIDSVGRQGRSDYRFDSPVSINATNGLKIYVADQNNNRVQMFDRRNQYLSSFTSEKLDRQNRFKPTLLTVSSSNELFVYDPDRFLIYKFDSNGNYSRELNLRQYRVRTLSHLKMSGSVLLLFDNREGLLHRFQSDGGYLNFIAGFNEAKAIFGTPNHIWALFEDRLEKFSHRGTSLAAYPIGEPLQNITDLSVSDNRLYVLTSNQLYTAIIE
ncbi:hypothetical protein BH23BAC3_BH23BAC3_06060 [soil metagenome]